MLEATNASPSVTVRSLGKMSGRTKVERGHQSGSYVRKGHVLEMSVPRCRPGCISSVTLPVHFWANKQSPRRREQLGSPPLCSPDLMFGGMSHYYNELGTGWWDVCFPRMHHRCLAWHAVDSKAREDRGSPCMRIQAREVPVIARVSWT